MEIESLIDNHDPMKYLDMARDAGKDTLHDQSWRGRVLQNELEILVQASFRLRSMINLYRFHHS